MTTAFNSHFPGSFHRAIEITDVCDRLGNHSYPTMIKPRIKLKAIRRRGAGPHRGEASLRPLAAVSESRRKIARSNIRIHELVGDAYTVLSLAAIIGVLIYHIVG